MVGKSSHNLQGDPGIERGYQVYVEPAGITYFCEVTGPDIEESDALFEGLLEDEGNDFFICYIVIIALIAVIVGYFVFRVGKKK